MLPFRWYCPPGVAKPAHAVVPGAVACLPHAGPPGAPPGGTVYGGLLELDEPGWRAHPGGWWYNGRGSAPALLIRLDPHPRLVKWTEIVGAHQDHTWRVPVMLEPVMDETGNPVLFKSALDRVWTGNGWDAPPEIDGLMRRLLSVCHEIGRGGASLTSPEAVDAALDALALGHIFDRGEIIEEGWVSEVLVLRTLLATCGMEIPA